MSVALAALPLQYHLEAQQDTRKSLQHRMIWRLQVLHRGRAGHDGLCQKRLAQLEMDLQAATWCSGQTDRAATRRTAGLRRMAVSPSFAVPERCPVV